MKKYIIAILIGVASFLLVSKAIYNISNKSFMEGVNFALECRSILTESSCRYILEQAGLK